MKELSRVHMDSPFYSQNCINSQNILFLTTKGSSEAHPVCAILHTAYRGNRAFHTPETDHGTAN